MIAVGRGPYGSWRGRTVEAKKLSCSDHHYSAARSRSQDDTIVEKCVWTKIFHSYGKYISRFRSRSLSAMSSAP